MTEKPPYRATPESDREDKSPLVSVADVERVFDAWVDELVRHHGDRTVAAVLSSPAIQSMFTGDIGQTALFDGVGDHGIECVCDECQDGVR